MQNTNVPCTAALALLLLAGIAQGEEAPKARARPEALRIAGSDPVLMAETEKLFSEPGPASIRQLLDSAEYMHKTKQAAAILTQLLEAGMAQAETAKALAKFGDPDMIPLP